MPNKEETKRKRMVVEEVKKNEPLKAEEFSKAEEKEVEVVVAPKILDEAAKDTVSIEPQPETTKLQEVGPLYTPQPETTERQEVGPLYAPTETPVEPKKSPFIALWIIIPGIFLLGAILGGIVFYQRGVSSGEISPTPTATPTASLVPSASPSASIDLTKYTISIFNGSGIAGEAGKAKTLLMTAGFKVGSAGNAATYDYTKSIIKVKSTVDATFVSALSTALGKTYSVDTPQTLASTSADTVQVVIGSSKAQ